MLSGLIQPSTGSVRVAGFDPFAREKAFLRRITLVMGQKQQLIWDLPALDSLRVNAAVYEIEEREAKRRIHELAELLEIGNRLDQPMRKLSLGERMKCEFLASLLHRTDTGPGHQCPGIDPHVPAGIQRTLQLDHTADQPLHGRHHGTV